MRVVMEFMILVRQRLAIDTKKIPTEELFDFGRTETASNQLGGQHRELVHALDLAHRSEIVVSSDTDMVDPGHIDHVNDLIDELADGSTMDLCAVIHRAAEDLWPLEWIEAVRDELVRVLVPTLHRRNFLVHAL